MLLDTNECQTHARASLELNLSDYLLVFSTRIATISRTLIFTLLHDAAWGSPELALFCNIVGRPLRRHNFPPCNRESKNLAARASRHCKTPVFQKCASLIRQESVEVGLPRQERFRQGWFRSWGFSLACRELTGRDSHHGTSTRP